jgi:hypothetical protein
MKTFPGLIGMAVFSSICKTHLPCYSVFAEFPNTRNKRMKGIGRKKYLCKCACSNLRIWMAILIILAFTLVNEYTVHMTSAKNRQILYYLVYKTRCWLCFQWLVFSAPRGHRRTHHYGKRQPPWIIPKRMWQSIIGCFGIMVSNFWHGSQDPDSWYSRPHVILSPWVWAKPSEWLLTNTILQKWWFITSMIRLQKTCLLVLSLLLILLKLTAMLWDALWRDSYV